MKVRGIFAALLLMMAGLQTAWAQKMAVKVKTMTMPMPNHLVY